MSKAMTRMYLAIRIEEILDANWRLRAVNWFRHGCGHQGWVLRL